jgi:RNA polymerase sigma-70 factor (ECF subfamily)
VKEGRPGAWNELVRTYQDRIYSLCLRTAGNPDLAADLAQDTMVKLVQHIDRYDGRCQFFTWVYRITLNTCLTRLRSEKLRRTVSLDGLDGGGASGHIPDKAGQSDRVRGQGAQSRVTRAGLGEPDAAERVEQDEARSAVLRAMQQLAPEHAAVLILRDAHCLEYQQIADALEVSVGTVKSRIFRARAALRDLLESPASETSPASTTTRDR